MSSLADLLGVSEPKLNATIDNLEAQGGHPNLDVQLISELSIKVKRKLRELGLDPDDTNGRELYHSLQLLTAKHDKFLAGAIGAKDSADVQDILPRVKAVVRRLDIPHDCWAIKDSVARKLLRASPPKRVMRQLHYKSIDSMLKRERITSLLAAAHIAESAAWREKFTRSYKTLGPSDFENRKIEILTIKNERWQAMAEDFVRKNRHNITAHKEAGAIIILPIPVNELPGITITLLPLLIRTINELRSFSAYMKIQQVKPSFGATLARVAAGSSSMSMTVAGQRFPWRVIHQYLASLSAKERPEIFGPHLQPEDLVWTKPENTLYKLEPALKFWEDFSYVGARHRERPVSFNLLDNAISYCNQLHYGTQMAQNFRESLKSELYLGYLMKTPLGEQAVNQLDNELVGIKDELEFASA